MFRALLAGAVLALLAGAASAQPTLNPTTWMCMDVNGSLRGADCKAKASRLAPNEDICLCSQGVRVQGPAVGEGMSFQHAPHVAGTHAPASGVQEQGICRVGDNFGRG